MTTSAVTRRTGFASVNGTRLYYEIAGEGEPVVLIHGMTLDTRMWDDQVEAFSERYQVIRYDVRGFGRSALPDASPYRDADDLKGLLEFLHVERAAVIGLSMGGSIALGFALAYPDAVKALVLVDSALPGFAWEGEEPRPTREVARESGYEAALSYWLSHPFFVPAHAQPAVAERLRSIVTGYSGWAWLNDPVRPPPGAPAAQRLHEVEVPTLVIVGERDVPKFRAIADTLASQISNARLLVLPGAGHMSNMESPERFNAAVLTFLDERAG